MSSFEVTVLGCTGGPRENNLSGYLVRIGSTNHFIVFDAGTLLSSIEKAYIQGHFANIALDDPFLEPWAVLFQRHIKGYFISHAHLDHLLGLVINSQDDLPKSIFGSEHTIDTLRKHIFNYEVWPNFSNEGEHPLNLYQYRRLKENTSTPFSEAEISVEAFSLNHSQGCSSTAFLIEHRGNYLLYFGDTAPDSENENKCLTAIWKRIAPLIRSKKLRALFLECSYTSDYIGPATHVHLNTKTMMQELATLQKVSDTPLTGLKVIVTHNKESLKKGVYAQKQIRSELLASNSLGIDFIFPQQCDKITL